MNFPTRGLLVGAVLGVCAYYWATGYGFPSVWVEVVEASYIALTYGIFRNRVGGGVSGMIALTRAFYFIGFSLPPLMLLNFTGLALVQFTLAMLFIIETFDYVMFAKLFGAFTRRRY